MNQASTWLGTVRFLRGKSLAVNRKMIVNDEVEMLDFQTGGRLILVLTPQQRADRRRRVNQQRRQQAVKRMRAFVSDARLDALARASRLVCAGQAFPIYFDVVLTCNGYSQTERYTLRDSALMAPPRRGPARRRLIRHELSLPLAEDGRAPVRPLRQRLLSKGFEREILSCRNDLLAFGGSKMTSRTTTAKTFKTRKASEMPRQQRPAGTKAIGRLERMEFRLRWRRAL